MTIESLELAGPALAAPGGLAQSYIPAAPGQDEMIEPDGSLRSHWRPLVSMLDDLGHEQVSQRQDQASRLVREIGITHNVYDEADGVARPWKLDLLPLLLPAAEWQQVGEALSQRARLLDALAADLYGPATSVASGILPPELVYANPGFLRPCHGIEPPGGRWIHLYAADVVRAGDGQFRVLADRTQAPSGAGYLLENRIVLTRTLATLFGQCNVLRLAPFFIALRQALLSLAPANRENPRVVLLTPGPYNETYFEHAYLSRYLGYTLVQGGDLTVRDCRVYLKTLSGLQRVDVILRRVDDDFCDPLELYSKSFLGVPGLLQAVREGTVAVANAIGAGVVQAPAFAPFLPRLCRHLIGEELALPSVRTWWCGDHSSLAYVLDHIPDLVLKPAIPIGGTDPLFGDQLSAAETEELVAAIKARPGQFIAQERLDSFMAPVLNDGFTESRRFVLRAYLTASDDSYVVMPGGLTRVTGSSDSRIVSLQRGGGSKDTWIVGDRPVAPVSLLAPPSTPVILSRGGSDLSSRVADDLFWLGRYVQRAESVVRLARCIFNRLSDLNGVESPRAMQVLMRELVGRTAPAFGPVAARELATVMFSERDSTGLRRSARRLHSLARILRDRISSDAWRILQSIEREISEFSGGIDDDQTTLVLEMFNRLIAGFLAFGGMAAESMTRGQSWRFLDIGLRLERGIALTRLIRSTLVAETPEEHFLLDAALEAGDASMTYRRRYLNQLEVPAVVDLLVADETNPRAVAYQLKVLEEHLSCLPRESNHPQRSPDLQLIVQLKTALRTADLASACRASYGRRGRLNALLTDAIEHFGSVSEMLGQIFFLHAAVSPRLLSPEQERAN